MYAWSYKYVYMGISISTKSKVYLHVQGKFWPTLINESLTVTHDIRKLADCMRKELNLKHQSLGAQTSAMANTRTRATVAGVPSSPCACRIRKGTCLLCALTSATWPAQTPSTMAFVLPFSWGQVQILHAWSPEHVVRGTHGSPSISGGLYSHV